jgi:hypothetical protein
MEPKNNEDGLSIRKIKVAGSKQNLCPPFIGDDDDPLICPMAGKADYLYMDVLVCLTRKDRTANCEKKPCWQLTLTGVLFLKNWLVRFS